jgi:hypothetical protein
LLIQSVSALPSSMLPWALDRLVSDACRARGADLWSTDRFTLVGSNAAGCPHHPRVAKKARFSACLAPIGRCWCEHPEPKLKRSAVPPVQLADSPKTAALLVRPTEPLVGSIKIGRIGFRSSRRRILAAPGSDPEGFGQDAGGIPRVSPLPVRFTRRCSVSGSSQRLRRVSRPSAQPRRTGHRFRA